MERDDARDLIAAARRELSPTAADRDRVRRATLAALAPAGAGDGDGSAGGPGETARVRPPGASWATRLVAVGVVAAAAAGVGYRAGLHAGREQSSASERLAPALVAPQPAQAPAAGESDSVRSAGPPALVAPPAEAPTPTRPPGARRRVNAATTLAPAAPAASPASLAEEVRALRAVERALREGTPGFALSLLRELDRTVPNGHLVEERLATRTIARCATGDVPIGVDLAEDFADRYPASVYGRRVADACAGTDSSHTGDSANRRSPHDKN